MDAVALPALHLILLSVWRITVCVLIAHSLSPPPLAAVSSSKKIPRCDGLRGPRCGKRGKGLSVHAGVSYSRPIVILNQLERTSRPNGSSNKVFVWANRSLFSFLFYGGGGNTKSLLNGLISSVLRGR